MAWLAVFSLVSSYSLISRLWLSWLSKRRAMEATTKNTATKFQSCWSDCKSTYYHTHVQLFLSILQIQYKKPTRPLKWLFRPDPIVHYFDRNSNKMLAQWAEAVERTITNLKLPPFVVSQLLPVWPWSVHQFSFCTLKNMCRISWSALSLLTPCDSWIWGGLQTQRSRIQVLMLWSPFLQWNPRKLSRARKAICSMPEMSCTKETSVHIKNMCIKQLWSHEVEDFATVFRARKLFGTFEERPPDN